MREFDYILKKVEESSFKDYPFRHVYIEDFLSPEHFEMVRKHEAIDLPPTLDEEELFKLMERHGYKPQAFPGCVTDKSQYLKWLRGGRVAHPGHTQGLLEGFGMAMRLREIKDPTLKKLLEFLNSSYFIHALRTKFGIAEGTVTIETAVQKYLTGYEISPHPDIRKKALTYLLNVNPSDDAPNLGLGTDLMVFREEYEHIRTLWQNRKDLDRFWVPWDWCHTVFRQEANNSILIFKPGDDTLYGVKLDYDHLKTQRTQIYGNLWWKNFQRPRVQPNWKNYKSF